MGHHQGKPAMTQNSERKLAIVTGGSSGVGLATAQRLADTGEYNLLLVGRNQTKLQTAAQALSHQCQLATCVADVADPAACQSIIDTAQDAFGRVDVVINNAGYAQLKSIAETSPQLYRDTFDINVGGTIHLTAAAWPMLVTSQGMVVNVSSLASVDPFPGFALYASAKIAVNMFTRAIATEGKEVGIRSVAIAPGAIETPLLRSLFDEQTIPREQTMAPEKVAGLIVDCITGERLFESGEVIMLPS